MSAWGNADLLVELLDRQREYVLGRSGESRLLLLSNWIRFVNSEPQLAGLTKEIRVEARSAVADIRRRDNLLRQGIRDAWAEVRLPLLALLAPDMGNARLHAYGRIEEFQARTAATSPVTLTGRLEFDEDEGSDTGKSIAAMRHWVTWALQRCTDTDSGVEQLRRFRVRVGEFDARERFLHRQLLAVNVSSAGAALLRIVGVVRDVNPAPRVAGAREEADDLLERQASLALHAERAAFSKKVFGRHEQDLRGLEPDEVTAAGEQVAEDVIRLTHELQVRLLAGRSRLALLSRFAARCENFDAAAIRSRAARATRRIERELTLEFAKYLFDQGVQPIVEHQVAELRADVTSLGPSGLLYVEAKQYGEKASKSTILGAYRQVWTTWGRLRNSYDVPEAFLLVFRLGGPRAELPAILRHRGLRVSAPCS